MLFLIHRGHAHAERYIRESTQFEIHHITVNPLLAIKGEEPCAVAKTAMENADNSFYSNVVPRFPEHLTQTMEKLPLDLQQRFYAGIFKPLDFYELLFERLKKTGETQSRSACSEGRKEADS